MVLRPGARAWRSIFCGVTNGSETRRKSCGVTNGSENKYFWRHMFTLYPEISRHLRVFSMYLFLCRTTRITRISCRTTAHFHAVTSADALPWPSQHRRCRHRTGILLCTPTEKATAHVFLVFVFWKAATLVASLGALKSVRLGISLSPRHGLACIGVQTKNWNAQAEFPSDAAPGEDRLSL